MAGKNKRDEHRGDRDERRDDGPDEQRLAAALARRTDGTEAEPEAAEDEFLCVRIKDRRYALPVKHVLHVLRPTTITEIPHVPHYIQGVVNQDGNIICVFDLTQYMGVEVEARPRRLVVLHAGDLEAAVPVSEVVGIVMVREDDVQPPLPHVAKAHTFITGQIQQPSGPFSVLSVPVLLDVTRNRQGTGRAQ